MKLEKTALQGVLVLTPRIFQDDRGYFFESFNGERFSELTGLKINFVQDNESKSDKNVLRGLHFQIPPKAQDKLIRVVQGSILDVAVDLRKTSTTYGKSIELELSASNKKQLFIPKGFAHGFLVLEKDTIINYKCTNYYSPEHEENFVWNDSELNIDWNEKSPILSEKDKIGKKFVDFSSPFT